MLILAIIIAIICAVIALELRCKVKRTNYIERKEIDQIREFRSKWK